MTKNAERNPLSIHACDVFTHLKLKQQSPRQYDNSILVSVLVSQKKARVTDSETLLVLVPITINGLILAKKYYFTYIVEFIPTPEVLVLVC